MTEKKWPRGSGNSPRPGPQRSEVTLYEVRISPAGDPIDAAGWQTLCLCHEECIEVLHAEEERLGSRMTHRERVGSARGFFAYSYWAEISQLMSLGVEEPEEAAHGFAQRHGLLFVGQRYRLLLLWLVLSLVIRASSVDLGSIHPPLTSTRTETSLQGS